MSTAVTFRVARPQSRTRAAGAWLAVNHAATIFISAFLLFQVQPLISKFILPWFGGSPAVWTTAMLFFQVVLFGGYAYAHLVTHGLSPRQQGIVHGVLLLAAVAVLPIAPDASWKPTGGDDPTLRILGLLLLSVGLPYLVLSTTGPLVQAWYSRAFVGRSPYRLYALSNVGSLLALLSYPFIIEPAWDVATQSRVWSVLFVVFAVLCALAAFWQARQAQLPPPLPARTAAASQAEAMAPARSRRLLWVALPAMASLMLLATTNHVCQDVAVVPFLWVIPLSLYLLSFIICFDHTRWYQPRFFGMATLVAVLLVAGFDDLHAAIEAVSGYEVGYTGQLALFFTMMFLVCMTCHGELVRLRPEPRYLTGFYLMISAGGALGGLFVSLIAPQLFNSFLEWQLALAAALVVALVVAYRSFVGAGEGTTVHRAVAGGIGVAGLAAIAWWHSGAAEPLDRARNFYGVVSVFDVDADQPAEHNRVLRHGAIAHGRQFMAAEKRSLPVSYYYPSSGIGQAFTFLEKQQRPLRVGTIGLGVGTTATYARPGDYYRFYEINAEVVRQAKEYFTFLKDCRGTAEVVLGDARLALEREPSQQFDLLVCDAFSGDSIPTHLATLEAFELYQKHLRPDGILAVNITNSYIDLMPMMRSMADRIGMSWTRIYVPRVDAMRYRTDWLLLTNNEEFLAATPSKVPPERQSNRRVPVWTDRFSNLLDILMR